MRRAIDTGVALMTAAILLVASGAAAVEVLFAFDPPEDLEVSSVSLRGSFNDWGETPMTSDNGAWTVTMDLKPGEYEYKFFINGEWPQDMESWHGAPVDPTADGYVNDGHGGQNAVRIVTAEGESSIQESVPPAPPLADGYARINYHRPGGDYTGWGLHVWGDAEESTTWDKPMPPTGRDPFGVYWDLKLKPDAQSVGFIIHKGDTKDPGPDMFLRPPQDGREVWFVSGRSTFDTEEPNIELLALGDLTLARSQWVDARTIAASVRKKEGQLFHLHSSSDASLALSADGVVGGEMIELTADPNGLTPAILAKFPHLKGYSAFLIGEADLGRVPAFLKGQLAFSVSGSDGKLVDATGVQIPGVLDDLFAYDGPLGVTWENGAPSIAVWAPTAQTVSLRVYDGPEEVEPSEVVPMSEEHGVWTAKGTADWKDKYYLYDVKVFVPSTGKIEDNVVTDPYSRSLSMNSLKTQIVDLNDVELKPLGWDGLTKPPLAAPEDVVLYELHIRDFSANDPTCPKDYVGTYRAFTVDSNGTRHLKGLAEAGLTHVHIMPTFDFASVNEDKSTWMYPGDLSQYPPDSENQQAAVDAIADQDPYNWGYDPYHYGTPEGSYSTDPQGSMRILEFRSMVKALSDLGLRVVMDVVYNHTHASGIAPQSVLDKVVPGYYHRLNRDGLLETSTCCANTASEHYMMERLMIDDLVHWATDYKVDGFRFDLMGHHMKSNMEKALARLHALTPSKDGVDGSKIYLYGEGWDFGEVQGGRRGLNATQMNMAGTGIGTFNDRIRDAIRGGSAFSDPREQGFATGMFTDPNGFNKGGPGDKTALLKQADRIRVGMAGNLRSFRFIDYTGREMRGGLMENVGYAEKPTDVINYCSSHDNETFFDKIQMAGALSASVNDRVRMQGVALSIVALGEGIPFFVAGTDMLRSKSLDGDSYNSGDWFNKLDWSYQINNFGVGLPPADKNFDRWGIMRPVLVRRDIVPGSDDILSEVHSFREFLRIRKSSPLFRLRTADEINARVHFLNTGPSQIPGLIVMEISDDLPGAPQLDPVNSRIVTLINAGKEAVTFTHDAFAGLTLVLHPVQLSSHDDVVKESTFDSGKGVFTIPARTTAVFVQRR